MVAVVLFPLADPPLEIFPDDDLLVVAVVVVALPLVLMSLLLDVYGLTMGAKDRASNRRTASNN